MPTLPDDPLRRVTLNLYDADVAWLIKNYGDGWTVRIRQHIHMEVVSRKQYDKALDDFRKSPDGPKRRPMNLGELES